VPSTPPLPWIESTLALELALRTGVSPLNWPIPCLGYPNGCVCPQCQARVTALANRSEPAVKQPWQRS
jgi:hypothetical protein